MLDITMILEKRVYIFRDKFSQVNRKFKLKLVFLFILTEISEECFTNINFSMLAFEQEFRCFENRLKLRARNISIFSIHCIIYDIPFCQLTRNLLKTK